VAEKLSAGILVEVPDTPKGTFFAPAIADIIGLSGIRRELGEVQAGRSAALPHLIGDTSSHGDQRRRVDAPVGRREAPELVGGALQEGQRAAAVSALSVAAADGDLCDALPEAAVPIIDVVGLPGILEELVGLEETSLVEQHDSSPASLPGGVHDVFRFSIAGQFIPASTGKHASVTITWGNASHAPSLGRWISEKQVRIT